MFWSVGWDLKEFNGKIRVIWLNVCVHVRLPGFKSQLHDFLAM